MRNYYAALGFRGIVTSPLQVERALGAPGLDEDLREDARFILLDPTRKAHYDWVLRCALELGEARRRLGLPLDDTALLPEPWPGTSETVPTRRKGQSLKLVGGFLFLVVVAGVFWKGYASVAPETPPSHPQEKAAPLPVPRSDDEAGPGPGTSSALPPPGQGALVPAPAPEHGWMQWDPGQTPKVRWRIVTDAGQDYLLILKDLRTQRQVLSVFLHGGEPFLGRAPEGEFEVSYSSGTRWFGLASGFGPESRTTRLEKIQKIVPGPEDTATWELALHPTSGEGSWTAPVTSPK